MKYLLIIFDGMADEPLEELGGDTPMQVARTPFMDSLAEKGVVGAVRTVPVGMYPGSDVTNLSILGYDPTVYYRGRAPLEAMSLEIPLEPTDVAFRTNLISTDGSLLVDSTAGHITTEESRELIELISQKLSTRRIRFYPGVSYRHIMVWRDGSSDVQFTPPYRIHGKPFAEYMPEGDGAETLSQMIYDSYEILNDHVINRRRRDQGLEPANMIWFWGQGTLPEIPSFFSQRGMTGSVVAAVDLIRGIGRMVGLRLIDVPGATGYIDTNFLGKGQHAVAALADRDFVWVHVEAADEAAHEGKIDAKIEAIENEDRFVLGTIVNGLRESGEDFRILLLPDHPTPTATQSHSDAMVPFLFYSSNAETSNTLPYDESAVEETDIRVEEGYRLIDMLFAGTDG